MINTIKSKTKTYNIFTPFGETFASRILSLATTGKFAACLIIKCPLKKSVKMSREWQR
jgi:hypothetical protein